MIDCCTESFSLCRSMKKLPKELFKQSTMQIPDRVGKVFSADVIRREKQKIFLILDIFSSFVVGLFIPNEQRDTLEQIIVQQRDTLEQIIVQQRDTLEQIIVQQRDTLEQIIVQQRDTLEQIIVQLTTNYKHEDGCSIKS